MWIEGRRRMYFDVVKTVQREEFSIGGPIMQEKGQNYVKFSEARQGKKPNNFGYYILITTYY